MHIFTSYHRYNQLIDWVLGSIVFRPHLLDPSLPTMTPSARAASLPQQPTSVPDKPPTPSVSTTHISLIDRARNSPRVH